MRAFVLFFAIIVVVLWLYLMHNYAYATWEKIIEYFKTFKTGKEEKNE